MRDVIDTNQNVAKEIQALGSLPDANADGLLAFGSALMKIARANQSQLDEEIGLDGFFETGQTTIDELKAAGISQRSTNEAKLTGTNEVDELDGRVHAIVRDLNHFARKALRDADKAERAQFYIFHHLTSRPSSNAPEPASPDTPTSDPAQG